jgi:hypothetical protein
MSPWKSIRNVSIWEFFANSRLTHWKIKKGIAILLCISSKTGRFPFGAFPMKFNRHIASLAIFISIFSIGAVATADEATQAASKTAACYAKMAKQVEDAKGNTPVLAEIWDVISTYHQLSKTRTFELFVDLNMKGQVRSLRLKSSGNLQVDSDLAKLIHNAEPFSIETLDFGKGASLTPNAFNVQLRFSENGTATMTGEGPHTSHDYHLPGVWIGETEIRLD